MSRATIYLAGFTKGLIILDRFLLILELDRNAELVDDHLARHHTYVPDERGLCCGQALGINEKQVIRQNAPLAARDIIPLQLRRTANRW
jgi:hypothetical protein